jgi:protein required for attachment to host cells
MTTTWVVVAHQAGARIMEHRSGFGRNLTFVSETRNPDGRKRNREIDSDRAGETFTAARGMTGRRAMHHEQTAHERVADNFARELADQIDRGRMEHRFEELILVAEPHFLGRLRHALTAPSLHKVKAAVTKDLAGVSWNDVAGHISDVLPL